jgi:hypothetical protein
MRLHLQTAKFVMLAAILILKEYVSGYLPIGIYTHLLQRLALLFKCYC